MYVQSIIRTGGRQLVCEWGLGSAWSCACVHYNLFRGDYSYQERLYSQLVQEPGSQVIPGLRYKGECKCG